MSFFKKTKPFISLTKPYIGFSYLFDSYSAFHRKSRTPRQVTYEPQRSHDKTITLESEDKRHTQAIALTGACGLKSYQFADK